MSKKKIAKFIVLGLILVALIIVGIRSVQNKRLFDAIEANDYDKAYSAIKAGADVNCHYRAFVLLPELVGRNPTPLIEACYGKSEEIIMLLLEKGADVNRCDNLTKESPLSVSVQVNNYDIAYELIDRGADINTQDISSDSILSSCCGQDTDPESEGHKMFRYLLNLNASLETPRGNILHNAVIRQDAYVVEYLLDYDLVDPKEKDSEGHTPLQLAEELGYDQIAELLRQKTGDGSPS